MDEAPLRRLYTAFNARDVDGVLASLAPDVDWPNAWEGGRLHGHDAVRDYWTRQFAAIEPQVDPTAFTPTPEGVAVTVHQVIRSLEGEVLDDKTVTHTYVLRDGLITRMDVS